MGCLLFVRSMTVRWGLSVQWTICASVGVNKPIFHTTNLDSTFAAKLVQANAKRGLRWLTFRNIGLSVCCAGYVPRQFTAELPEAIATEFPHHDHIVLLSLGIHCPPRTQRTRDFVGGFSERRRDVRCIGRRARGVRLHDQLLARPQSLRGVPPAD